MYHGLRHLQQNLDSDAYCGASELMIWGKLLVFFLPQVLSPDGQLKGVIDTCSAQMAWGSLLAPL